MAFTTIERALLTYLLGATGRPVPREELLREVWGYAAGVKTRTVQTTVQRVRQKIEAEPSSPTVLLNLRGRGYQLVLPGSATVSAAAVVTREELERRLSEWLGEEQDWVTLIRPTARKSNVGDDGSRFVGRASEGAQLRRWLDDGARLITLHGAAGLGKTRLSREIARQVERPGGSWYCDLSDAHTAADMRSVIATSLGLVRTSERSLDAQIVAVLRSWGPTLLVLDNFEQLEDSAAMAVEAMLEGAPELAILATSRRRLGLAGERVLALAPLSEAESLELLRDRIDAVRIDRSSPLDPDVLRELAFQLEGVPLAVEMAAARARILPLEELRARIKTSFGVLRLDRPGVPDRQHTLAHAVDWSWQLLSEDERRALVQLSVCRGGFPVEVAERLLRVSSDPLSVLASLLDKSMLRRFQHHGGNRLGLFRSVQEFALERGGERLGSARARHAEWAVEFATSRVASFESDPRALQELLRETDNLVEAGRWLLEAGDPKALSLVLSLFPIYNAHAVPEAWPELLRDVRTRLSLTPHDQARVHAELAYVHDRAGNTTAALAEVEAGLARLPHGAPLRGELHQCAVSVELGLGHADVALARGQSALDEARQFGWGAEQVRLLNALGAVMQALGDVDEALVHYEQALAMAAELGVERLQGSIHRNIGGCLSAAGELQGALQSLHSARIIAERFHDVAGLHGIQGGLAATYGRLGRYEEADALFRELLPLDDRLGGRVLPGVIRLNAGISALLVGDPDHAYEVLAEARARHSRVRNRGSIAFFTTLYLIVAELGRGELEAARELASSLDQFTPTLTAGEEGEVRLCLAHLDVADGKLESARETLAGVDAEDPGIMVSARLLRLAL